MAPAFQAWLDRFFDSYYRNRPVDATFIGFHDHDHRLPDLSERGIDSLLQETESLLEELDRLAEETTGAAESIDRSLARGFLEIQRWELASGHFHQRNPAWYTGEAVFGAFSLLLRDFALPGERLESLRSRLNAVPDLLEQGRRNVGAAPRAWTERAIRECEGALDFFDDGLRHVTGAARLKGVAGRARSAFAEYREHLERNLLDSPSEAGAIGAEALDLLLSRGHFLEWSAAEIFERAQERLSTERAALEARARSRGERDARSLLGRLEEIRPTREGYYARYRELWEECRALAEQKELLTWPDYPVDFVPRPPWARKAAGKLYFLFYRAPAPLDLLPRVEYLVTPLEPWMSGAEAEAILRETNESVIKLNHVVHHGGIGHHVQNWHAHRAPSRIGRVAAVDAASRIALFCGGTMAEGWASYAAELVDEVGFLTSLESCSEHHARVRAAARAIVDVKLHLGEMSGAEAERFYREQAFLTEGAAHAEVTKNSMFPGTALTYFVGASLIHELRRDYARRLGDRFDLAEFHDRFLAHGSIPVALSARAMLSSPPAR